MSYNTSLAVCPEQSSKHLPNRKNNNGNDFGTRQKNIVSKNKIVFVFRVSIFFEKVYTWITHFMRLSLFIYTTASELVYIIIILRFSYV